MGTRTKDGYIAACYGVTHAVVRNPVATVRRDIANAPYRHGADGLGRLRPVLVVHGGTVARYQTI